MFIDLLYNYRVRWVTCQSRSNIREERQHWSSPHHFTSLHVRSSVRSFAFQFFSSIHHNACVCVLTSQASNWLISIFYFNMVQQERSVCVFLFVSFVFELLLPFESVLNMMFNICQCLCRSGLARRKSFSRRVSQLLDVRWSSSLSR